MLTHPNNPSRGQTTHSIPLGDGSPETGEKSGVVKFPKGEELKSRQFFGSNHVHVDTTAHNHIGGQLPHRHSGYDDDYYGGYGTGYGTGYGIGYGTRYGTGYGIRYGGGYYDGGGLYGLRNETDIELWTEA